MTDWCHRRLFRFAVAALAALFGLASGVAPTACAAPPGNVVPTQPQGTTGPIRQSSHTAPISGQGEAVNRSADKPRPETPAGGVAPNVARLAEEKTRLGDVDSHVGRQDGGATRGSKNVLATLGSLAVVLGLFFAVAWTLRRSLPKAARRLPSEVVEVLGQANLGHRQHAQLVRLGKKLLLISVAPSGAETLAEVTDAAEVDRLAALCRDPNAGGATATFRDVFQQFRGRSSTGPPGNAQAGAAALAKGRGERSNA